MRSGLPLLFALLLPTLQAAARPEIVVIEEAPWSPADPSRDGAAELAVLVRLAQLADLPGHAGFVGIGDRRGLFQAGTHRGLELAVLHGVPVVRLACDASEGLPLTTSWFIDGGRLSSAEAAERLATCLVRHGPLPVPRQPFAPTPGEIAALRRHLARYQADFTSPPATVVAQR